MQIHWNSYLQNSKKQTYSSNPTAAFLQIARKSDVTTIQIFVARSFISALVRHRFVNIDVVQRAIRTTAADLVAINK